MPSEQNRRLEKLLMWHSSARQKTIDREKILLDTGEKFCTASENIWYYGGIIDFSTVFFAKCSKTSMPIVVNYDEPISHYIGTMLPTEMRTKFFKICFTIRNNFKISRNTQYAMVRGEYLQT